MRALYASLLLALIFGLGFSASAQADAYRSKIYLDPSLQLGESVSQSLEDLQAQYENLALDDDSYAKASAGRQLAQHFLREGQYAQAAAYYEDVLAAGGLASVVNTEILKTLAGVYLRVPDYAKVIKTLDKLQGLQAITEPNLWLIRAQAQYKMGNYLGLNKSLGSLMKLYRQDPSQLKRKQLNQVLALYYEAGNYKQSEALLKLLIDQDPHDVQSWRQLVSIYLAQDKHRQALNQLALSRIKGLPMRANDWHLLADLYAKTKAPQKAAQTLQRAIEEGHVEGGTKHYRRLFEFWLRAREPSKAMAALSVAAKLGDDPELYLYLAQLQMEQKRWSAMQASVEAACAKVLPDKYVSRANLFLGISRLKLGDEQGARRSLINATLIGSSAQARKWLNFIQALPATSSEVARISAPCQPADPNTGIRIASSGPKPAVKAKPVALALQKKTVPKQSLYTSKHSVPAADFEDKLETLSMKLAVNLMKGGGSIDGPLMVMFENVDVEQEPDLSKDVVFKLAFPTKGRPRNKGGARRITSKPFDCAYRVYQGPEEGLEKAWAELYQNVKQAKLKPSGEQRLVWGDEEAKEGQIKVELQIGLLK